MPVGFLVCDDTVKGISVYILGIDVGTTGTKTVLVDASGTILAKGYKGYALLTPGPGRVEQDARLWWDAVVLSVRQACAGIDSSLVCALSLSTQGASSLLVDSYGMPLTNALTWMDGRSGLEADFLADRFGKDAFYRKTGWLASPALDAAKLSWLAAHESDTVHKADKFLSTLDFLNRKLVGQAIIDPTNAAMRQLMNLETMDWDNDILDAVGLSVDILPEIRPSGEYIGNLEKIAAEELGLSTKVRIYNGAHDQYCACLGSGIGKSGEFMLSTGTSWVLMTVSDKPVFSPSYISPGPHVEKGLWGALASIGPTGAALEWYKNIFLSEDYPGLEAKCDISAAVENSVFFLPYLAGRAFPRENVQTRAAFFGLGFEHDRYAVAMAVMEGAAFQMRAALDEFKTNGCAVSSLCITGGALNSRFWTGLIDCNMECEVFRMSESDTACIGAAAIAGAGFGLFPDYRTASGLMNKPLPVHIADSGLRRLYTKKYDRYRSLMAAVPD